jgi:hypothetical protein
MWQFLLAVLLLSGRADSHVLHFVVGYSGKPGILAILFEDVPETFGVRQQLALCKSGFRAVSGISDPGYFYPR